MNPRIPSSLLVLCAVALVAACGLLGGFAAHAGVERAGDPTARELALRADQATKNWLDYILYGVLPGFAAGVAGGKAHERRKVRTAKARASSAAP